jgi:hypothetical protein
MAETIPTQRTMAARGDPLVVVILTGLASVRDRTVAPDICAVGAGKRCL